MKVLIFINLVAILSSFQLQAQRISYKNGRIAWDGIKAYHDNARPAWDGTKAYYDNARPAWDGTKAYHDNARPAWDGTKAYYDNARSAWDGIKAYYDNGQPIAQNLYTQNRGVKLDSLEINEFEISNKIKLLTKTFNNRVYVVGLKIKLSEKNTILIDKEHNLTTNIIQLGKDIHFEVLNRKVKLSVLGQNVVSQK
jgi:hypothetical protein